MYVYKAQAYTQVYACALYTVNAPFQVSCGVEDLNTKLRKIFTWAKSNTEIVGLVLLEFYISP
jgi:hypothetical protein